MYIPATVTEVLEYAISEEIKAHDYYLDMEKAFTAAWVKTLLHDLAAEEVRHQELLQKILDQKKKSAAEESGFKSWPKKINLPTFPGLHDLEDCLLIAMSKEQQAEEIYLKLADTTSDNEQKKLYLFLASEEKRHYTALLAELEEHFRPHN